MFIRSVFPFVLMWVLEGFPGMLGTPKNLFDLGEVTVPLSWTELSLGFYLLHACLFETSCVYLNPILQWGLKQDS